MSLVTSVYDSDDKGNENRICFWLRLDGWHLCEAAMIFVNIDPDNANRRNSENFTRIKTFNGLEYPSIDDYGFPIEIGIDDMCNTYYEGQDELGIYQKKYDDMHRILFNPDIEYDSPSNWIERAILKKINIPWLEFALSKSFYTPKKIDSNKQISDKPLTNKERQTLLVIIAAMAKELEIDVSKVSKSGVLIENLTQLLGVPIGATTIETHLKQIPEALQSRAK
jgi:hypothetical protein